MISVLHIGSPLGPPWLTQEDGEKIAARLLSIRQQMLASGFQYAVLHASPDSGLAEFRTRLRAERIDAVLIGGGVTGDPRLSGFKTQIVDVAHEEAPQAKVLEFDHSLEVPELVKRAFGIL